MDDLSKEDLKLIELFWNKNTRSIREKLPVGVIAFLDAEAHGMDYEPSVAPAIMVNMQRLRFAGYVHEVGKWSGEMVYRLDAKGMAFLKDKHPRLIVLWERTLDRTPSFVSFIVTLVGLFASVLSIVEVFGKK